MKYSRPKIFFKDKRGSISDIFYKKNINHVAIIKSKKGVLRGNHYHKKTTQYMYITKGSLQYWYKKLNSKGKAKMKLLKEGDLVETPPNEMHALKIGKDGNEFIVFTVGKRGGKDYENDTYRFTPPLVK
ncbi:polysaccharide biosynthesis C-terminal domain-containing protein [Candidatus Pelagibacter sp.]|uniref:polysaccharide biosynthesis C-terminal domain-containing protein n=1 Tax=Candidatus Pelagibacter sp. TaxID=2024849 RepID=UPI003F872CF2